MSGVIDRRRFIRDMGMSAAALALLPRLARAERRGGLRLAGAPQNVVILGGGLAGLAAAYELKRAGHKVTILEARKFPGGRLQTIRDFSEGLYAEAGPSSFPQDHEFTWGYASDFGLPMRTAYKIGLDQIALIRGNRFRIGPGGPAIPLDLKANERQAGVGGLTSLYLGEFMRQMGNPRKPGWPPESLRAIDALSLKQLLRNQGASESAIDIIEASSLGLLGFGLDSFSGLDGALTEAISTGAIFYEIVGGNDQLAQALKKKVKKQFKKKCIVTRIEQNTTGVTITYTSDGEIQTIAADRAVCALPFTVLRDIEVFPAFSEGKQRAIRELKLTPVTRTFMEFRSRVWEQDRLDGYGITDLEIQNTYSPTLTQPGTRGLLASYAGGQRALDLGALSEDDRQSRVLRKSGDLFGGLNALYEGGTSQVWQDDEFARGAYTYFEPGQLTNLLPEAQRAEGRIHFAGEHTSAWHGWMNGALESGNRAADEVNKAESAEAVVIRSESDLRV
ncbi:MAG TPA: NAD(P)/FAD-dependent oxidoreductase [Blastocatellia bacterium]|nr:NAD(P)/FAD-dependent oxidoreductase [Blastocatellia bacterium]